MAIYKTEQARIEFTNEELLENLLDLLYEDYPDWHIIQFKNASYDMLLIKTFTKTVTRFINPGSPNPLHVDKPEETQMVIAVTVDVNHEKNQDRLFSVTKSWTAQHIVTDNMRSVLKVLKDIDKENK